MADAPNGNGNGARPWLTWVPAIAGALAVLGGIIGWFVTIGNLQYAQNDHERRLAILEAKIGGVQQLEGKQSSNCQQFATIEEQFSMVETIMNKTQAGDQRDISLIWNKVYDQIYPNIFYPITIPHDLRPC